MQTFQSLGLSEPIVQALTELGITTPTPIQAQAIPPLMEKATDFLGLAQTGTGKTAAFGLPMIELIDPNQNSIQAIVLAPTRELAQQISTALRGFAKFMPKVTVDVVYGGTAIQNQIRDIKRTQPKILIATPGRMIDLIDRKVLNLSNVRLVVLDEADEMLNMGFKEDIDTILSFTQQDKNTWLFSATMPREIRDIVHRYMHEPVEVSVSTENRVNTNIEHRYAVVRRRDKRAALERIIDAEGDMYALIFCRTKNDTQDLAQGMAADGYPVEAIHGDLSQQQRNTVMKKFKAGSVRLLAATDVAARGIDVDNLSHVIHYELPDDLSFYTHRSGRTARAGKKGIAVSLISPEEQRKIHYLEKQLGITFKKALIPSADEVVLKNIQSKMDDLLGIEPSEEAQVWVHTFAEQFETLSKEDLIARYITTHLNGLRKAGGDLNASGRDSGGRDGGKFGRDRDGGKFGRERDGGKFGRDKGKGRGEGGFDRPRNGDKRGGDREEGMSSFYVGIGKEDRVEKGDLLRMLCDATGVRSKNVGRIRMFDRHSIVDISSDFSNDFVSAFDGVKFDGRPVRVKPDEPRK